MTAKIILNVKKKSGFNNYKEVIILTGWFTVGSIDYILNPTLDISSINPATAMPP